jgi:hypothetical protein
MLKRSFLIDLMRKRRRIKGVGAAVLAAVAPVGFYLSGKKKE